MEKILGLSLKIIQIMEKMEKKNLEIYTITNEIIDIAKEELKSNNDIQLSDGCVDLLKKIENSNQNKESSTETKKNEPKSRGKSSEFMDKIDFRAKNFVFIYEKADDVSIESISSLLNKKFPSASVKWRVEEDKYFFEVNSLKRREITSISKFCIGERKPIIRTFGYWATKDKLTDTNLVAGSSSLSNFLLFMNQSNLNRLTSQLKISLSNVGVFHYSEYIISCIFFGYLNHFGILDSWNRLKIFSVDSKLEEFVDGEIKNFRCDLIFMFTERLFVVEFKYLFDRKSNQAEEALKCIKERGYLRRVKNQLSIYPEIVGKIDSFVALGIGYTFKDDEINCDGLFEVIPLKTERNLNKKRYKS